MHTTRTAAAAAATAAAATVTLRRTTFSQLFVFFNWKFIFFRGRFSFFSLPLSLFRVRLFPDFQRRGFHHVRKIQIVCWTFCLDGSKIVRSRSLLGCIKRANAMEFAINVDLCYESVMILVHTSVPNRIGGFQFFFLDSRFLFFWRVRKI